MAQEPLKAGNGDTPVKNPIPDVDITKIRFCTQKIAPAVRLADPLPQGNFTPHQPGDDPPLERLVCIPPPPLLSLRWRLVSGRICGCSRLAGCTESKLIVS